MAQIETWLNQDMMQVVKVRYLDGNLFSQDNAGNLIGVKLTRDGVDYSGGGSVSANVIRSDGGTVAVTGALSGNVATVVLPQAAYAVPGVVSIVVKLTVSGEVATIAAVVANIYQSSTETAIDPGTIIPSIQTLVNQINTAVASIPADYSSLWTSIAPAFSTSTAYTAGQYVTYDGGLYQFTADHAAGSWSSSDVSAAVFGNELSDLKKAIINESDLFRLISYKDPSEIKTYLQSLIKNGTYDSSNMKHVIGTTNRLCPLVFVQFGNTIRITANSGYQVSRYIVDSVFPTSQSGSGWSSTLLFKPYVLSSFTIRKSNNEDISTTEFDNAITIAVEAENNQLSKIENQYNPNAISIRNHFDNIALTQELYGIVLPQAIRNFVNEHLINGSMDTETKTLIESSYRLTLPFPIRSKTKFMLSVISGYEINRLNLEGEFFNSYTGNSGWQSAVTILPNKYYLLNIRKNGGASEILPSEAPLRVYYGERYGEPIDFAVGKESNVMSIGHRGFASGAPENTMASYKMAVERGFLWVEGDVLWTSDLVPVMIHDSTIDRTSDGTGNVIDYTYEQLQQYDFGSWFSPAFAGEKIPTFKEYVHYCKTAQVHPYIEIKTDQAASLVSDDVVNTLIEIVKDEGMIDKTCWTSSGNGYLKRVYQHLPEAKIVYLASDIDIEQAISILQSDFPTASIQLRTTAITEEKIEKIKAAGIPLVVGILDTETDIRNADSYASGVLSNLLVASTVLYDYAINR